MPGPIFLEKRKVFEKYSKQFPEAVRQDEVNLNQPQKETVHCLKPYGMAAFGWRI